MTDSWNNMNIYTHWHGSTKLRVQLFMCCVQACHSSWLLSVEQLCGSQRQSTHTQPRFALVCINAVASQNDAKVAKADFTPGLRQGAQRYAALAASCTVHSSAPPLFLHEARRVFHPSLPSLKGSLRLRPQRQSLRAPYSLYSFVRVANTPFSWCQVRGVSCRRASS